MKELAFIFPVRIDSSERLRNLELAIDFAKKHFPGSDIQVIENDEVPRTGEVGQQEGIHYTFVPNPGRFPKSVAINAGLLTTKCPHVVVYDIDILIDPGAIRVGNEMLKKGYHVVLPHNTIFVNVAGETKRKLLESMDLSLIPTFRTSREKPANKDLNLWKIPSGVVMYNRDSLIKAGGYNKKMNSYGWEDIEVLKRMAKLGYLYFRVGKNNLIHLDHPRGMDSKPNELYKENKAEFQRIMNMSRKELETYAREEIYIVDNPIHEGLLGIRPSWKKQLEFYLNAARVKALV